MNAPDRYERFVVPEGTKKVSYERDTKIINAASFTIEREDHTIGNILRMQLHRDPHVLFAGYKLPHPLQYKIIVRIHTTSQSSPMQAYNQAITDLDKELNHLKDVFEGQVGSTTPIDWEKPPGNGFIVSLLAKKLSCNTCATPPPLSGAVALALSQSCRSIQENFKLARILELATRKVYMPEIRHKGCLFCAPLYL
ncbi:hypothetical protein Syun_017506 [Stephania yunnanensis]|uniref:DNA-directed RNA polymerase RBP11-like dimerisation domain-containing protein n=1 Tax=Stephania yunnanensis TaxID=152371 RepID=A0AAP0P3F4_9MAGN